MGMRHLFKPLEKRLTPVELTLLLRQVTVIVGNVTGIVVFIIVFDRIFFRFSLLAILVARIVAIVVLVIAIDLIVFRFSL